MVDDGNGQRDHETRFAISVPPDLEAGVYANFLSIWHTAYEFTLDFGSTQPARHGDPDDPDAPIVVPSRVVARIKIPPTLIFDILQVVNDNMTRYESVFGEIRRPGEQESP